MLVPAAAVGAVDAHTLEHLGLHVATLAVVHARRLPTRGHDPAAAAPATARCDDVADKTVIAALARADTTGIAEVRPVVRRGSPSAVILDAASNAELIVLGTRGCGVIKRMLLSSVAMQ